VPTDLPDASEFFKACGWTSDAAVSDLVLDLDEFVTPHWVHERAATAGLELSTAIPAERDEVVSFERSALSGWAEFFAAPFDSGEPGDVLIARSVGGTIVGTVLIWGPSARWHGSLTWTPMLGPDCGALGAVGVAPASRERGIGLALVARATELLRERGLARSYVGWTWLTEWYGKLGYRVWRDYHVSERSLTHRTPN
jgi:beta-N-acetylhexosaminidase